MPIIRTNRIRANATAAAELVLVRLAGRHDDVVFANVAKSVQIGVIVISR